MSGALTAGRAQRFRACAPEGKLSVGQAAPRVGEHSQQAEYGR